MNGKVYYGWVMVGISMLLLACVNSPIFTLSSLFIIPVSLDLGVPRAVFTTHMMICNIGSMLGSFLAGRIMQRFRLKPLVVAGLVVSGFCFLGYSFATSVWSFYLCSLILGFCFIAVSNVTISIVVTNWFPDQLRGKAMGIAACGSGIGSFVLMPVVSGILSQWGWRLAYRGFAGMSLLLALPVVLLLYSPSPGDSVQKTIPLSVEEKTDIAKDPSPLSSVLHRSAFWFLLLFSLLAATASLLNTTGYSYFCDIGIDSKHASWLMSAASCILILSKVLLGALCDRKGAWSGSMAAGICFLIAYSLALAAAVHPGLALAVVLFFGFGNSITTVAVPLLVAECLGKENYASLIGVIFIGNYAGSGLGPVIASAIYDHSGSYFAALWLALILTVCMMAAATLAWKPHSDTAVERIVDVSV